MSEHRFRQPTCRLESDGSERRVGFELEFSGITLDAAVDAVAGAFGVSPQRLSAAEATLEVPDLGRFGIELDWELLKRSASNADEGLESELLERIAQFAERVVPVEVVCPPVPLSRLDQLAPMVDALRTAGARGTGDSLIAAYGVHINASAPALDLPTLWRYVLAYALLQWWLVEAHAVDPARRLSPYVDLYPEAYVQLLCDGPPASLAQLCDHYLEHNPTRNRALDMLPLLSELDTQRVRMVVDDPRIKARPAFHYRLPNCQIDRADWSLADSWTPWWVVEQLAQQPASLERLAGRYVEANRGVFGRNRAQWTEQVEQCLRDLALA